MWAPVVAYASGKFVTSANLSTLKPTKLAFDSKRGERVTYPEDPDAVLLLFARFQLTICHFRTLILATEGGPRSSFSQESGLWRLSPIRAYLGFIRTRMTARLPFKIYRISLRDATVRPIIKRSRTTGILRLRRYSAKPNISCRVALPSAKPYFMVAIRQNHTSPAGSHHLWQNRTSGSQNGKTVLLLRHQKKGPGGRLFGRTAGASSALKNAVAAGAAGP